MTDDQKMIVRAMPPGEFSESDDGRTLFGRIARANEWAEIHSDAEGHFMERFAPGAFAKTFAEGRERIRILFNHGRDPSLGNQPIAVPTELGEDEVGGFYRATLLDGVPPLIVDGLRKNQYGSSHTFRVTRMKEDPEPQGGSHNPKKLPERTITEAQVYELGPVTWPAYAGATVGLRSMTDEFLSPTEPDAPSVDAEAQPHLDERRDDPVTIAEPEQEEPTVAENEYHTIDEMGARVRELDAEIKRGAELPGILPDTEQAAFDEKVKERAELDHAITAWHNRLAQVRVGDPDVSTIERYQPIASISRQSETDIYDLSAPSKERTPEARDQKWRDNAMRVIETTRFADVADQDSTRDRMADLVDTHDSHEHEISRRIIATASPIYRRAFKKYVTGRQLSYEETQATERAAMAIGVDSTGGFAVPFAFDPTFINIGAHTSVNPYRAACRVETITGTDTWHGVTSTAVSVAYATEAAATTEGAPTLAQPEVIVKRAQGFATVSYEAMQDRPDLGSELARLFSEAKDTYEENQFTLGVGTTVFPAGMFLLSQFTTLKTAGAAAVVVGDILAMEAALPIRWRANGSWFLTRAAIRAIQAFETTGGQLFGGLGYPSVGNPVQNSTGNTGLTLLGYPVWETPSAPWTPTTPDTNVAVFCDPSNYLIVDRLGMSVELVPNLFDATTGFPTGNRGVMAFWRNSAKAIVADGGRTLVVE